MREQAALWWEQAKHDLDTADYLLAGERLDAAAFYFQQAVEKGLKARYIDAKRESPGAIHSLTRLGRECGVPGRFSSFLRQLTGEYYLSRYPDATGDVPHEAYDVQGVQDIQRLAHEVIEWLEQQTSR